MKFADVSINMPKKRGYKTKREFVKANGHHAEITTIHDDKGKVIHTLVNPLMVEFHPRDLLQIMLGSALLAIPVGYTEETWHLGETLPLPNVLTIMAISLLFIAAFVYYNYYKHHGHNLREHLPHFLKRVIATYVASFIVVAFLLTVIQKTEWVGFEALISFNKVVIVTFPASISAAVADFLK